MASNTEQALSELNANVIALAYKNEKVLELHEKTITMYGSRLDRLEGKMFFDDGTSILAQLRDLSGQIDVLRKSIVKQIEDLIREQAAEQVKREAGAIVAIQGRWQLRVALIAGLAGILAGLVGAYFKR